MLSFLNRRRLLWPITLSLAVTLVAGCKKAENRTKRPPRPVTVATAETRAVPLYQDEIGNCSAYESVTIQPQVSGMIVAIHFKDGDEVNPGDPLFTIDPRPFQAALDKAKATLEQNRAKAAFDQAQLKRNEELFKTRAIASQDLDNARTTAKASEAAIRSDEASVETAQINLEYAEIRSPITGRTGKRMADMGNVVGPGTPLLVIQRQDPIYVDFTIPESTLPRVRHYREAGTLKVEAAFADDPSKRREGEFNFLDNAVQQNTGTVRVRAVLDNKDRLFWPGQFVNVRLLLDILQNAVLVPNEALQINQNGPFIYVLKPDSTVELRPVKPGQRQGSDLVVEEGLKAGEVVVVNGQIALSPGAEVTVVPPAKAQ
jgi:multidrug efflux system membrane fusion protein